MTVTSAPVSMWNFTGQLLTFSITSHCSVGCFLPFSASMNALASWINFLDWSPLRLAGDLHTTWKWPCFLHFLQNAVGAAHCWQSWGGLLPHLGQVWSMRDLLFSTPSFWIAPTIGDVPLSSFCWDFTTSFWRTRAMAEASVSFEYICICSDSWEFLIPTTILSLMRLSWRSLYLQCSANVYKSFMNASTDSPSSCTRRLNLACSNYCVACRNEVIVKSLLHGIILLLIIIWETKRVENIFGFIPHAIN